MSTNIAPGVTFEGRVIESVRELSDGRMRIVADGHVAVIAPEHTHSELELSLALEAEREAYERFEDAFGPRPW